MNPADAPAPPGTDCRLLAFDTATEQAGVALLTPQRCWSAALPGGAQASATLVPALMALLAQAGIGVRQLDAIAYGRGPGAFTGLRTACSVAQGLAFGAGRPVLPLDSLMLVAEAVRPAMQRLGADRLWVAQDARMDEVYAAAYRWHGGAPAAPDGWETLEPPALLSPAALSERLRGPTGSTGVRSAVAGSALGAFGDRLDTAGLPRLEASADERAAALATLALAAWRAGAARDATQALPLYLRDKVALTTGERQALHASREVAR
jgi:tRNA threonylcarbamoyladenosine biosynthesis protein TsaB